MGRDTEKGEEEVEIWTKEGKRVLIKKGKRCPLYAHARMRGQYSWTPLPRTPNLGTLNGISKKGTLRGVQKRKKEKLKSPRRK